MRVLAVVFLALSALAVACGGLLYWYYVIDHPGEEFSHSSILRSLSIETPVFYDDGKELMGVFFESEHRMYVRYEDIPASFVNAIVAAEDKNFFRHSGIDPLSILRASVVNLRAGKIIQGGSTLSQQTAKNLFKRKGRTFESKFKEFIQTLKLEAHYSKEEIMEFFINQFYVSGTGRGLGIAAKYFFDKSVDELTLLESAFIAGSVRAPTRYNPLIQSDPEKRRQTLRQAIARKNYVLRNMLSLDMISPEEYRELEVAPIPFQKGRIYYQLNVIMDYVRDQLQSENFQEVLSTQGISNISTSGIQVTTSINKELQGKSLLIMRKHLAYIETLVSGYNREAVQSRYANGEISVEREPRVGKFLFGRVEEKTENGTDSHLQVRLGETVCRVDYHGLMNLASPYAKSRKGLWAEADQRDVKALLSQIEPGDLVYVFVRDEREGEDTFLLDLMQKPQIEGGLVVLNKGKIVAMVGGGENIYFNRAANAQRQLGSIFKPLVYTAALQLGWNILDHLENRRDVFVFQNEYYFPRPDHVSPHEQVSLAWAGVKSENLATIWLLYHLCDQLSLAQFEQVAQVLDLAPREGEGYYDFRKRLRDQWGIIVRENTFREMAFAMAKDEVATDLIFDGKTAEAQAVGFLKYGTGFEEYREVLFQELEVLRLQAEENGKKIDDDIIEEYKLKDSILLENFLRYQRLNEQMIEDWNYLKNAFRYSFPDPGIIYSALSNFYTGFRDGREIIVYGEDLISRGFTPLTFARASNLFEDGEWQNAVAVDETGDIWIEGEIQSSVMTTLHQALKRDLPQVRVKAPYTMATLWKVPDYRILVGLLYVVNLCQEMGIETQLDPVLSFPLGPNAVNILEMARAYSTLLEGKRYEDRSELSSAGAAIIAGIMGPDGEDVYHYDPQDRQILDTYTTTMVNETLRNVVLFGTGRKARQAITMELDLGVGDKTVRVNIPSLGKTGTANEYSNSSYIGFVPGFSDGGTDLSLANAFVIAVYVGYDDNQPMENDHLRIFGASGALPIWIDVANAIVQSERYQSSIDPIDFAFLPQASLSWKQPPETIMVPIDKGSGLPLSLDQYFETHEPVVTVCAYGDREGSSFRPTRYFSPLEIRNSPWQEIPNSSSYIGVDQ